MTETKRLFFALWPDNRQRERLRDIVAPYAKTVEGQPVFRGNWHVTLAFIGNAPATLVPSLLSRADAVTMEPFRLRFDRLEYWARPRIACLVPTAVPDALTGLVGSLESVLMDLGHVPEERSYRPHMTLVRRARPFTTERLAQPLTLDWEGFELMESVSERGDVRYLPLKQ